MVRNGFVWAVGSFKFNTVIITMIVIIAITYVIYLECGLCGHNYGGAGGLAWTKLSNPYWQKLLNLNQKIIFYSQYKFGWKNTLSGYRIQTKPYVIFHKVKKKHNLGYSAPLNMNLQT